MRSHCSRAPLPPGWCREGARERARRRINVSPVEQPSPVEEPSLEDRIRVVRERLSRLQARIREQCPGPHEYVQQGDGKLPWCDACRFTDTGLHLSDLRWTTRLHA